jgi:hypothetical protein
LTMSYFNNFNNESLNKYKKDLKNKKNIIDVFFYLWIDGHSNLMVFDGLSNDNKII